MNPPADFQGTGRFTVQRRLGAGGFGVVYQAYDNEKDSVVALKTLTHADAAALYRFKHEFRALADVSHPNLATLYELISDGEQWFFTMELVEGVNFLEYVRGGTGPFSLDSSSGSATTTTLPLFTPISAPQPGTQAWPAPAQPLAAGAPGARQAPPLEVDRLQAALTQLARGVSALHQAGQLHRDLKPSNVLVDRDGRVVILDFGLATELGANRPGETDQLVGTPAYMSPEQARGSSVSEASDWYSVGIMLYEALTGEAPFQGSFLEVAMSKQKFEPPNPSEVAANVPEHLDHLCRDLLRRDPQARPSGVQVLRRLEGIAAARSVASGIRAEHALPLVGRQEHLGVLKQAYLASKSGHAVVVFLHGSSGMGKTALAHYFLQELRTSEDAVILSGRCYERESVPYKALDTLVDALSQYLKRLDPSQVEALLPRDVMALSRLFPVLRQVQAIAGARRRVLEIPDSQELRRRAFAALRDLFARLAEQKAIVLFIDDLQWGDVDSADLLAEMVRPPDPPPLLLIAGYRSEEAETSPLLQRLLPATRAPNTDTRDLAVKELSLSDARGLALSLLGESSAAAELMAETIARESLGNPFFIQELVRFSSGGLAESGGAMETGGATLAKVIQTRVSRLPEAERRLLEVVAVAGQPLKMGVARRAAAIHAQELAAVTALRSAHLVRIRGSESHGDIETYHDRIRETVVAHLPPEALQGHHRQLAFALEASGHADPETLAVHFQAAGERDRAAEYATEAAEQAVEALAFDRAARLYSLVLDLKVAGEAESRSLRVKLADALANAGRGPEAARAYQAAADGARGAERLELQRRVAEHFLRSGYVDDGIRALRAVLMTMGMKLAATPRQALLSLLLRRAYVRLRGLNFRQRDPSQVSTEELIRVDTCWSVAVGLGIIDNVRGADFHKRHLILALRAGEPYRVARALALEVSYSATGGSATRSRTHQLIETTRELAERISDPHALGLATLTAGIAAYLEGRWKDGAHLTDSAAGMLRERCTGVAWELANAELFRFLSLYYLGELEELSARLPAVVKDAERRGDLFAATSLRARISFIAYLAADDPDKARRDVEEAIGRWSRQGFHIQHLWAMVGKMEVALYCGDAQGAWNAINESWPGLARSMILRIQQPLVGCLHHRARCALALAAASGAASQGQRELLHSAQADARRMERHKTVYGSAMARLIRAGVAATLGKKQEALALATSAEAALVAADMGLYAAAARRRRGELLGGEEGAALVAAADSWMAGQKIRNPSKMADMLAPGTWPATPGGSQK